MKPRVTHVLYLLLVMLLLQSAPVGAEAGLPVLEPVGVSGYQGEEGQGLRLTFKRLRPNPALALWRVGEAREVVEVLEGEFKEAKPRPGPRLLPEAHTRTMAGLVPAPDTQPSALERRVREEYEGLLGPALVALPDSLESARWFQALKLSPRYMGAGVREAALELFGSPAVLLSVGTSMVLYMMAWAAPEPLFSKAFAAAVTMGLLLTYSATELYNVGQACLTLYREAEAARTREELEAAAERFGKALGGVGLRVLVTVAGACAESGQDGHNAHHLCTNKNDVSESSGGPWTPRFEKLFARAGMSLDDPANIVYLRDHKGPHPEAYHREIFRRLEEALGACRPRSECRAKLVDELNKIAADVCQQGSRLNKLATKIP